MADMPVEIVLGTIKLTEPVTNTRMEGTIAICVRSKQQSQLDHLTKHELSEIMVLRTGWLCRGPGLNLQLNVVANGAALEKEQLGLIQDSIQGANVSDRTLFRIYLADLNQVVAPVTHPNSYTTTRWRVQDRRLRITRQNYNRSNS